MRFIIITLGIILTSCFGCSSNNTGDELSDNYFEYLPVYRKNEKLVKDTSLISNTHKQGIKHVFTHYKQKWKEAEGRIYYQGRIDDELLWNYTTKANDSAWLKANL